MTDEIKLPEPTALYNTQDRFGDPMQIKGYTAGQVRQIVIADRENAPREYTCLTLLADIRTAAGDPEGRLMQPELLERIRRLAGQDARRIDPALLLEAADHLTEDGHSMDQDRADMAAAWLRATADAQRAKEGK